MNEVVWLVVAIVSVGCLNACLMFQESAKHFGAEAKLWREFTKTWECNRDQWDTMTRLWNALDKKEDKHEC